jgi:hypothetical protein
MKPIFQRDDRAFLKDHLETNFKLEDMLDVINTINPANGDCTSLTSVGEFTGKNGFKAKGTQAMDIGLNYDFATESSAKLFESLMVNLDQHLKSDLILEQDGNQVSVKLDHQLIDSSKKRDTSLLTDENFDLAVANKTEKKIQASIFYDAVGALMSSGLYQVGDNPSSRIEQRHVDSFEKVNDLERRINKGTVNLESSSLYKAAMFHNAIENNPNFEKELMTQIMSAKDNILDNDMADLLALKTVRDLGVNTMSEVLDMNPSVKNILDNAVVIEQETQKGMFEKFLNKVENKMTSENDMEQPQGMEDKLDNAIENKEKAVRRRRKSMAPSLDNKKH